MRRAIGHRHFQRVASVQSRARVSRLYDRSSGQIDVLFQGIGGIPWQGGVLPSLEQHHAGEPQAVEHGDCQKDYKHDTQEQLLLFAWLKLEPSPFHRIPLFEITLLLTFRGLKVVAR